MGSTGRAFRWPKGGMEKLPSGALWVYVYAGIDPVTKGKHYLRERSPAGTLKADGEAEKVLRRLQVQVDERRQPRTNGIVKELVTRHVKLASRRPRAGAIAAASTVTSCRCLARPGRSRRC